MSEQSWLTAKSLDFVYLRELANRDQRKMRLFLAACCRRSADAVQDPRLDPILHSVEQHADGAVTWEQMKKIRKSVRAIRDEIGISDPGGSREALSDCVYALEIATEKVVYFTLDGVYWARSATAVAQRRSPSEQALERLKNAEEKQQLRLARCIFGNPFRPVAFDPRWRSESAVALARTAYDTRNFSLLPILADALEDAGCDNPAALAHLREPDAPHARGCWVVDLVLGK